MIKKILVKIADGFKALIQGDVVSSKFFMEHFFSTSFLVISAIAMIALRFECATSQNTVDRLQRQINVMNTEKQKQRSLYMTMTRESAMIHLVDSLHLGLTIPDRRPETVNN